MDNIVYMLEHVIIVEKKRHAIDTGQHRWDDAYKSSLTLKQSSGIDG